MSDNLDLSASAPTLDIPRARKVLEHLRAHPEEHKQTTFGSRTPCGTACCVAGTVVLMEPTCTVEWDGNDEMDAVRLNNDVLSPSEAAGELLGLTPSDAYRLFLSETAMDEAVALDSLEALIVQAERVQS